jgi:hypothetical protein
MSVLVSMFSVTTFVSSSLFSLPLLFISYRRSTRPRWRHRPHSPLATPTCKPVTLSSAFTAALTAYRITVYYPSYAIISQPTHSEHTGQFLPIIHFSSPLYKLPPLQLILCQWPHFTIYSTTATPTTGASHSITITNPSTTTTAAASLPMVCTASEPLASYLSH